MHLLFLIFKCEPFESVSANIQFGMMLYNTQLQEKYGPHFSFGPSRTILSNKNKMAATSVISHFLVAAFKSKNLTSRTYFI